VTRFAKMLGDAHRHGELHFKYRVANMFMAIARDERLSKVQIFALTHFRPA
jgi:hypothetical protein